MPHATAAKRAAFVLSDSTLLPLGFVIMVATAFAGMAKWVGAIDARQEHERELNVVILDQLKALTDTTREAVATSAATRAQVEMIVRELDRDTKRR